MKKKIMTGILLIVGLIVFWALEKNYGLDTSEAQEEVKEVVSNVSGLTTNLPTGEALPNEELSTRIRDLSVRTDETRGHYVELSLIGDVYATKEETYITLGQQAHEIADQLNSMSSIERTIRSFISDDMIMKLEIEWYLPVTQDHKTYQLEEVVIADFRQLASGELKDWKNGEYTVEGVYYEREASRNLYFKDKEILLQGDL